MRAHIKFETNTPSALKSSDQGPLKPQARLAGIFEPDDAIISGTADNNVDGEGFTDVSGVRGRSFERGGGTSNTVPGALSFEENEPHQTDPDPEENETLHSRSGKIEAFAIEEFEWARDTEASGEPSSR